MKRKIKPSINIILFYFYESSGFWEFPTEGLGRLNIVFSFSAFSFGFGAEHSKHERIDTPLPNNLKG